MATTDTDRVEPAAPRLGGGTAVAIDVGRGGAPRVLRNAGWYVALVALSVVVLFPVYMIVVRALSNPDAYLRAGTPPYPVHIEWNVFSRAWGAGNLSHNLLVSALVTIGITAGQVVTSCLAAYAFAFLQFRFKRLAFALFMATLMLPIEVTLIANVETMRRLGWLNTYQGLVLPFLATALGTFLIRQGFLGVPNDLRDAARLDGHGHLRFLTRVAIPLSRPVIASFTVIAFLSAWNQYLWPQAATTGTRWDTVQIGLASLNGSDPAHYNVAFAGAILAALPIVVVLIVFSRQIIRGLTAGAVKG
ncbi:MAG TPA: carbohydrate ABC transporter permease [Acidimicrobiales bacterium]|jgi:sn-glycerol 3-phosphate transport system permease protein|nr:carbohydrate ABC transporter permease [Acidimicrobiales bacterium]